MVANAPEMFGHHAVIQRRTLQAVDLLQIANHRAIGAGRFVGIIGPGQACPKHRGDGLWATYEPGERNVVIGQQRERSPDTFDADLEMHIKAIIQLPIGASTGMVEPDDHWDMIHGLVVP